MTAAVAYPVSAQDSPTQPLNLIEQFEKELQNVVKSVEPSVVTIRAFSREIFRKAIGLEKLP